MRARLETFIGACCTRLSSNPEDHGIEFVPAEFGSNPSGGRGRAPPGGAQVSAGLERGGGKPAGGSDWAAPWAEARESWPGGRLGLRGRGRRDWAELPVAALAEAYSFFYFFSKAFS